MLTDRKLTQLPNGDWLDTAMVISVRYLRADAFPGAAFGNAPDRVVIICGNGANYEVTFPDSAAATKFRDEFAAQVNAGRGAQC